MEFLSSSAFLILCVLAYAMSMVEVFYYYAYFFLNGINSEPVKPDYHSSLPAVSVIVCLRKELENLKALIPAILEQSHPNFELILVADRAEYSMLHFLEQQQLRLPRLKIIRISSTPPGISPKKHALRMGIQEAVNPVLLFTDADCLPSSQNWISAMAFFFLRPEIEIVLGYGAYQKEENLLNLLIRFDTLFTAGQYLGMALEGKPYMGVGRNLAYRKELFLHNKGFAPHEAVLSGDDDLFVNRLATASNVAVCGIPEAFTFSVPCTSVQEWFRQKIRHQSVAVYYRQEDRVRLGILHLSRSMGWIFTFLLFLLPGGLVPGISLLLFRAVSRYFPLRRLSQKLEEELWPPSLIVLDVVHSFFLSFLTLEALLFPPKKWS